MLLTFYNEKLLRLSHHLWVLLQGFIALIPELALSFPLFFILGFMLSKFYCVRELGR